MWILPSSIASAFSAEPGASTWALNSDLALEAAESSLTWRGKPTPAKSWFRAWKKATWIQRLFGRMSRPSMDARFADWWTSSLAASRVRTSLLQESERASQARGAASGSNTSESSPRFSLDWSSLKTSQPSARAGSKSSSKTLPRSGTMRSGVLSERPMLAQRITETGSSFWQTPRATDGDKGGPNQTLKGVPSLVNQARSMWPTATAHDAKDTGAPTEFDRKSPGLLATALSGLSAPTTPAGPISLPKGRTLNPRFVEWLMGWPIGWTDCDSQVTEWFLLKPLSLSAPSLNERAVDNVTAKDILSP